jgi:hypothetical protein
MANYRVSFRSHTCNPLVGLPYHAFRQPHHRLRIVQSDDVANLLTAPFGPYLDSSSSALFLQSLVLLPLGEIEIFLDLRLEGLQLPIDSC